jgi:hypothetical protein
MSTRKLSQITCGLSEYGNRCSLTFVVGGLVGNVVGRLVGWFVEGLMDGDWK